MSCKTLCILGLFFFGCSPASARVFYLDGSPVDEPHTLRQNHFYPMNYPIEGIEQASRDLDLSFAAGDPGELLENRGFVYPAKRVYAYSNPETPSFETNRDYERPTSYYRLVDVPTHRIVNGDQYPESNRKVFKIGGPRKGEIVLEMRVTANSDNDRYLE